MLKLIDGKALSQTLRTGIKEEVEQLKAKGTTPGLAVILVGEDPASQVYVRNKEKACEEVGIYSEVYRLPYETTEEELLKEIDSLKEELFNLRFQQATGQLDNPARMREVKKTIARIKTVITERELSDAQ